VYELFPSVADALRAMSPDASTAYEASLSRNN
jgi:hypothetical protein